MVIYQIFVRKVLKVRCSFPLSFLYTDAEKPSPNFIDVSLMSLRKWELLLRLCLLMTMIHITHGSLSSSFAMLTRGFMESS